MRIKIQRLFIDSFTFINAKAKVGEQFSYQASGMVVSGRAANKA
jgi:hypothetical protein